MNNVKCPQCETTEIGRYLIPGALWWCASCKIHFDGDGLVHYQRTSTCFDEEYLKAFNSETGIWEIKE